MDDISALLKQAALAAGEAVRIAVPSAGITEKEGRANFVTAADLASEKIIIDLIRLHFPDHSILSEETDSDIVDPLAVEHLWVIDPIDGTSNFRYERGYSSISIGYVSFGVIMAAAVYDPFRDQLFFAEKNAGAFLNDTKLMTGTQIELGKSTIATDNSYDPAGTRHNLELMLRIRPTPWFMMRGSAVLSIIDGAAGRVDLYFHTSLKPWDNAAAFLIAEEAGAKVTGIDGSDITFLSPHAVVGNPLLVDHFLASLNRSD